MKVQIFLAILLTTGPVMAVQPAVKTIPAAKPAAVKTGKVVKAVKPGATKPVKPVKVAVSSATTAIEGLKTNCYLPKEKLNVADVKVVESGKIESPSLKVEYYFQLCSTADISDIYAKPPYNQLYVGIFERTATGLKQIYGAQAEEPGFQYFDKPKVTGTKEAPVVVAPSVLTGSASINEEAVFLIQGGRLVRLDTKSWVSELSQKVQGQVGLKGIYPDYSKMKAETPIWKKGDGNCCPSGGMASVLLEVKANRLAVKKIDFYEPLPKDDSDEDQDE